MYHSCVATVSGRWMIAYLSLDFAEDISILAAAAAGGKSAFRTKSDVACRKSGY